MASHFFNDAELAETQKQLAVVIRELENLSSRIHDFSKQRMRMRLSAAAEGLDNVICSLPKA